MANGRKPNSIGTVTIKVSTNPIIENYLEQLARTGLYGKNPAEAAERLIAEGVGRLLDDSLLKRVSLDDLGDQS